MADVTVTQSDLANLARKLDELGAVLTEKERALLLAVFRLAAASIASKLQTTQTESGSAGPVTGPVTPNIPPLSGGFREAFSPLGSSSFSVNDMAAGGVGIGVVY